MVYKRKFRIITIKYQNKIMKFLQLAALTACAAAQDLFLAPEFEADSHCVAPGTCTAPMTKFLKRATVIPRDQWTISGGFCGSLSI